MAGIIRRRLPVFSTFIKTLFDDTSAGAVLTTLGVSSYAQTLLDDASASATRTTLGIANGTYTPTLTNLANLDASTAYEQHYTRIGDVVTVSGQFEADATAGGGTTTIMGMSLPVSTTFSGAYQLAGACTSISSPVRIRADTTNHRAVATWASATTANIAFVFTFQYRVI